MNDKKYLLTWTGRRKFNDNCEAGFGWFETEEELRDDILDLYENYYDIKINDALYIEYAEALSIPQ